MTSSSGRNAALLLSSLLATWGCGTFNAARPLAPGEHAVGATLGGPLITLGAPLPIPSLVVEGRHGLQPLANRPFDLHYGLNATAAGFGIAQGHVGAAWQLTDAKGGVPALTVANRVFLADNHLASNKAETAERHFWPSTSRISWRAGTAAVAWLHRAEPAHGLRYPGLHLAPVLGVRSPLGAPEPGACSSRPATTGSTTPPPRTRFRGSPSVRVRWGSTWAFRPAGGSHDASSCRGAAHRASHGLFAA